jgi:hypothetical protein
MLNWAQIGVIWQSIGGDSLGNAIHEQTAHTIIAIEDGYPMTGFIELISRGQTSGSRADDRNLSSRSRLRRTGLHPAHLEALKEH